MADYSDPGYDTASFGGSASEAQKAKAKKWYGAGGIVEGSASTYPTDSEQAERDAINLGELTKQINEFNRLKVRAEADQINGFEKVIEADPVNHPSHYTSHPSGVECIEITQHHDFLIGNAIKYLWRAGLKDGDGKELEDLKKAEWYINRKIQKLEGAK